MRPLAAPPPFSHRAFSPRFSFTLTHLQIREDALKGGPATDVGGRAVTGPTRTRIDWLTTQHLERIEHNAETATTLYREPTDGRYWERTYPRRDEQEVGDGPPALHCLTEEAARQKYAF